ncbi:Tyr recombinase domain-containing protein (Fragment) [Durusdinium trenchii]|uniref:Tyr recombinase domain-containing protein n=1 Tax=Durusdinium trenchii TaxID=1381693 RepID=A0ABP0I7K4_9DINO
MSSWRRELTVLRDDGLTGGHCQQADALPSSWDREQSIVVRGVELTGHGPGCVAQSRSPEALACRRDRLDEPVVPKGAADETFMSSVAEGYVFPPDPPRFESVEDLPQRPASRPQVLLGFPAHYTAPCAGKSERKSVSYVDTRLTLLGNTWSVPVIAWLLNQMLFPLGLALELSPQRIMDLCQPGGAELLQGSIPELNSVDLFMWQNGAAREKESGETMSVFSSCAAFVEAPPSHRAGGRLVFAHAIPGVPDRVVRTTKDEDQVEEPRSSKSKGYAEARRAQRMSGPEGTAGLVDANHEPMLCSLNDVAFTSRPLGVDFKKTVPLKVKFVHPRSVAADAEVEEDWALVSIHGEAMPRNLTLVRRGVAPLVLASADPAGPAGPDER